MKFDRIVRTYIRRIRPRAQGEIDWFANQRTLSNAIEKAGTAENSKGKRYSHQRRLKKSSIKRALCALQEASEEIGRARSFDDLFELIRAEVQSIPGIGELYVYDTTRHDTTRHDTSLRIGARLNVFPRRVYLHAGARAGARALGLNHRAHTLSVSALPKEFRALEPHEIEDVLCIFKKELRAASTAIAANDVLRRSWCG
jgi:hypothetical protein